MAGKAVCVLGDTCSGHGCFPPRANIEGSPDVFVNGQPVHRESDGWASHSCPDNGSHTGKLATGSSTVFINGKPAARIGDPIDCGSVVAEGSSNVFIGG